MLFTIKNKYIPFAQLRTNTLLDAYFIIKNYPMHASDLVLDNFIQAQYNVSLKNMCIKLLLGLTFYKNEKNELILLFKNPKYDEIARLITYGNGVISGSNILKVALSANNREV